MLKLLLLGIGLLLVFEGLIYFFLSNRINLIIETLNKIEPQTIKTISILMIVIGACLIYCIFRFYGVH